MPIWPRCGSAFDAAPHEIVGEFARRRLLERSDLAALRIDAVEDALDRAVLAGRVHALKDQQQRPAILGVQLLLKIAQPLAVAIENFFGLVLVETALLIGLVRFQMELARSVEAERRDKGLQIGGGEDGFDFLLMKNGCPFRQSCSFATSIKAVTKRGMADVRSRRSAHQMDGGKFGLMLPGEIGLDPGAQRFARAIDIQYPDHRDAPLRVTTQSQCGAGPIIGRCQTGLFLDFAGHAAGDIDRAIADIVEIGRARRESRSVRHWRCAGPFRPARRRRRKQRSAPMPKPLNTSLSGKPQSRHARKLAKSVSK